jgi:fibronectin type 3 domain-containing protein
MKRVRKSTFWPQSVSYGWEFIVSRVAGKMKLKLLKKDIADDSKPVLVINRVVAIY